MESKIKGTYFTLLIFLFGIIILLVFLPPKDQLIYLIIGSIFFALFSHISNQIRLSVLKNPQNLALIIGTIIIVLYAFEPLTKKAGWPIGHDQIFWKYRVSAYYYHFKQFDFFPLWSSGDCFNMGAPLPLYYHKLHNFLTAILLTITNHMKLSNMLSLMCFSVIGIFGIYKSIQKITSSNWLAICVAWSYLFMNYTATNWFIRAAHAEFTAMMLLPFLFNWCLALIINKKFNYNIVWILTLIFLAHNVIAFYGIFVILLSLLFSLIGEYKKALAIEYIKKGLISSLLFLLLNSIHLIPMLLISDYYDVSKIQTGYTVDKFFHSLLDYFYDSNYTWGLNNDSYSVEINSVVWVFILSLIGYVLIRKFVELKKRPLIWPKQIKTYLFLTSSLVFFVILQSKHSLLFYEYVPGAMYIQFPWRLLTFIQIILLIILAILIDKSIKAPRQKKIAATIYVLLMMLFYPFVWDKAGREWNWSSQAKIAEIKNEGVWGSGGEYMPNVQNVNPRDTIFFKNLALKGIVHSNPEAGLTKEIEMKNPESITRMFESKLSQQTEIIIPINYSGLECLISIEGENTNDIEIYRTAEDPRIRFKLSEGNYLLKLYLPTISTAFSKLF